MGGEAETGVLAAGVRVMNQAWPGGARSGAGAAVGALARKGYAEGLAYRVVRDELRAAGDEASALDEPWS